MFFALLVLFTTSSPLTPHLITEELRQLIKKIQQTSQNREVGFFFFLSFSLILYLFILFSEIFRNKRKIKGRYQCILAKGQRLEIHVSSVSEAMQRAGRERERKEEKKKIFPPSSLFILINIGILC